MAVAPRLQSLAGKWQIPLLALSAGLFVAGLLELRPAPPAEASFDDIIQTVRIGLQAERYEDASRVLTAILNEKELQSSQRAQAHRLLAETIWLAESSRSRHDPENAKRILSNFAVSQQLGTRPEGPDFLKLAQAADWLGNAAQAVESYAETLEAQVGDRTAILKRLVEILLASPRRDWPRIDGYIDDLLVAARGQPDTLLRAVQWKIQRLFAEDDVGAAKALLKDVESKLDVPPWSHHLQSFAAQVQFREEQYEAAEARLRALQGSLRRSDPLYAEAGWLLGRINYIEGRPEISLSFYDEVVRTHAGTEHWLASLVGRAEALATLQRYTASAENYKRSVDALRQFQGSLLIDEQAIRQSLRTLATVLSKQGRPEEALPFAQMAAQLVPQDQEDRDGGERAELAELQAAIRVQAADAILHGQRLDPQMAPAPASQPVPQAGHAAGDSADDDPLAVAREHLVQAGELYSQLAKYRVLQAALAQEAAWQSAMCFDRAGRVDKSIEAFRSCIRDYAASEYAPEAMHRLGLALQLTGEVQEAVAIFENLLAKFERTQAALAALIPLGRCYVAMGPARYEAAEKVWLSIVEEDPVRHPLFTPAAPEFREALMELANLYMRWDKPERAIERLEQTLALYDGDPDITPMQYQLGDAYRRSGLALLADAGKTREPTQAESLRREAYHRLGRAKDLFDRVAGRLDTSTAELSAAEQVYLKTSYVYRADCSFDMGQFTQAADLYGRVAWRWQNDAVALSAYVQIVRSYLAAGEPDAARSALARARWILKKLPDSQFSVPPDTRTRAYWTQLFDWVEQSGLLASSGGAP